MRAAARLVVACLFGAVAPAVASASCKLVKIAEFPVLMRNLQPLTTAKINDHDVQFIIDSGADYSRLSPASAAGLGLTIRPGGGAHLIGAGGGTVRVGISSVKTLTLAGVPIHDVEFWVGGSEAGTAAVGNLGQNVLHLRDVEYDLGQAVVRLMNPEGCDKAELAYWTKPTEPFSEMDIEGVMRQKFWTVGRARINDIDVRVLFDTGTTVSSIALKAAARAGLKPDSPGAKPGGVALGIDKATYMTYIVPVSSFKIGDEEIKNTRLRIGDIEIPDVEMVIGADFFLSHRIYVANSQHKLYFTYGGGPVFNLSAVSAAPVAAQPSAPGSEGTGAAARAVDPSAASPAATSGGVPASTATAVADGEDAADLSRRGEALASRQEFLQALADLDRACALAPDNADYAYQRGMIHWRLKHEALALADFDRAIRLKPDDAQALLSRAQMKFAGDDKPGARADLDAAEVLTAKQADVRLTMADLYGRLDLLENAIHQLDQWIDFHEADARWYSALVERCGVKALQGVDLDGALRDCNTALSHAKPASPFYAEVVGDRGLVRLRLAQYDRSIADYEASLKIDAKGAWALYGRGIDKLRQGKSAAGRADMDAAVRIHPDVADIFNRHGISP